MRTALVILGLVASAPALADNPGALPGEAFTFKFSVGPVDGGRARMSIGKPVSQHGRRVVAVHGEAETTAFVSLLARMQDDYKLVYDTATLLPLSVSETERGVRERRMTQKIDGRFADLDYWAPEKQLKGRRVLARVPRDPLSSFFALRSLALSDGQRVYLDVIDGPALWRAEVTVKRGASVHLDENTPPRPAIRLDAVARRIDDGGRLRADRPPRRLTMWLSDDAARVLLRLEADTDLGRCALVLTSYIPPRVLTAERAPSLPGIETR